MAQSSRTEISHNKNDKDETHNHQHHHDDNDDKKKEHLQERLIELEYMKAQAEEVQQQMKSISESLMELKSAKAALESVSKLKTGDEILVPAGGGIFIKARISESETVISSVGAGVLVDKKTSEVIDTVDDQIEKLTEAALQTQDLLQKIGTKLQSSALDARELMRKK